MKTVHFYRAVDLPRETHEVSDARIFLQNEFGRKWPPATRITCKTTGRTIVPASNQDITEACAMPGPLVVEVPPSLDPATWTAIGISLLLSAASYALSALLAPTTKTPRAVRNESPNNGLSDRQNTERVGGRIPDIYGTVRSTPDMVMPAYKVFQDNIEMEISYMCIGRGTYEILDVRDDTTDTDSITGASVEIYGPGTSPVLGSAPQYRFGNAITWPVITSWRSNNITGQELMAPDQESLKSVAVKFVGPSEIVIQDTDTDFTDYFVAGDQLVIQNASQSIGMFSYSVAAGTAKFSRVSSGGQIHFPGDHSADWAAGQQLTLSNGTVTWQASTGGDNDYNYAANVDLSGVYGITGVSYDATAGMTILTLDISSYSSAWSSFSGASGDVTGGPTLTRPSGDVQFDLSGTYTILALSGTTITLDDPAAVNAGWATLVNNFGGQSNVLYPNLANTAERWVGWYEVKTNKVQDFFIANIVAENGLYRLGSTGSQHRIDVNFTIQMQAMDDNDNPTGPIYETSATIEGSATTRTIRAYTLKWGLSDQYGVQSKRWQFRMRRTSATYDSDIAPVDTIQWRDLYACSNVTNGDFGDVTTVLACTLATDGALAVKERKLNTLVTRQLPQRQADNTFSTTLASTNNVADIFCAAALDKKIGNRSLSELDVPQIYDAAAAINAYFGIDVAQFNYTIDDDSLSFEDIATSIAQAAFCQAYRRGNVLRLFFEKKTADSSLLFNHRNKKPGTEQRTEQFTQESNYDGIEFTWIDPTNDDATATIYLPADQSAVNPQKIETSGIRNEQQAMLLAWRAYNKILYQTETVTFDALPEANLLTLSERIVVSDNTRGMAWDGDVVAVDADNSLRFMMSQPFEWGAGPYTIFLQGSDGTVESMTVSSGGSDRWALLSQAPHTELIARGEAYNATGFIITDAAGSRRARPFLLSEKDQPNDDGTIPITAYNYDDRYYEHDQDYASS